MYMNSVCLINRKVHAANRNRTRLILSRACYTILDVSCDANHVPQEIKTKGRRNKIIAEVPTVYTRTASVNQINKIINI